MAIYVVKLVDHTDSDETWLLGLGSKIQDLFNTCMEGSSHQVKVVWGTGAVTDNLVLHFVNDVDHSYIQQKMPGEPLSESIAGHTRHRNGIAGTEFYKFVGPRGNRKQFPYINYAKIALHESLHNLFPGWTAAELHGPAGGGGLASIKPELPPTEKNKEMIQRGLSVRNPQLL
ncbi:MAG: hypothetical protein WB502_12960 [Thermoactinomyces sp.]